MTRPSIIRADTLDLQDADAPSAKDHSKVAVPPSAAPAPLAPHQAETLREVAHETAEEESRSPRASWSNGDGANNLQQYVDNITAGVSDALGRGSGNGSDTMARPSQQQQQQQQQKQDDLAVAQNGGQSDDEGDMQSDDDMDDDLMDKISSSPSIEDEDIDFEFVYALHTFVATVEGQANATKGDTMVLLDDSNSYWWLVRVVKDSSIGYLPAEHIETPTERLARLNKHRNIDLSATMLGDQAAKQKNAFKSIRRRRKTVTFADPTYVDYSEIDYSSDEDEIEELFGHQQKEQVKQQKEEQQKELQEEQQLQDERQQQSQQQQQDPKDQQQEVEPQKASQSLQNGTDVVEEAATVEPLKTRSKVKMAEPKEDTITEEEEDEADTRTSEEVENKVEGPSRSRNGTVRNTDSFFRDESLETKKITLTPNLLRDDNQPRPSTDSFSRDLKSRPSLDKLEKDPFSEKDKKKGKKDERRDKDKKPSAIRSFFSRKDRKKSEEDDEGLGKRSMDASEPRESEDLAPDELAAAEKTAAPPRHSGKLQKQQPRTDPASAKGAAGASQRSPRELSYLAEGRTNDVSNVPPASMRIVDPDTQETQEVPSSQHQTLQDRSASAAAHRDDKSNVAKVMAPRSASAAPDSKPQKAVKARARMELDDSDSSEAEELILEAPERPPPEPVGKLKETPSRPHLPGAFPDSSLSLKTVTADSARGDSTLRVQTNQVERNVDFPLEVSPLSPGVGSMPPPLMVDASPIEGMSPEDSPSPEPSEGLPRDAPAAVAKEHSWDDEKLRAFFDGGDHVRDLLAVVYDKTDVVPVGMDHPLIGTMFREQNAKLAEITTQLDNLLGDWMARKQRLRRTT